MTGLRDALVLFISNGFSMGGFTAFALNLLLPFETEDAENHKPKFLRSKSNL